MQVIESKSHFLLLTRGSLFRKIRKIKVLNQILINVLSNASNIYGDSTVNNVKWGYLEPRMWLMVIGQVVPTPPPLHPLTI